MYTKLISSTTPELITKDPIGEYVLNPKIVNPTKTEKEKKIEEEKEKKERERESSKTFLLTCGFLTPTFASTAGYFIVQAYLQEFSLMSLIPVSLYAGATILTVIGLYKMIRYFIDNKQ